MRGVRLTLTLHAAHMRPRRLRRIINQIIGQLRASRSLILPAVKVAACPDLTQAPYGLAASGLGGRPVLVDVGGVMNLQYVANRQNAHFDIGESPRIIASHLDPHSNPHLHPYRI